ncbi:FecR family protein [Snuella sedimenti]|uniref:FecR family protein n=1 Tax=Snuella sedimenti TaxID=2798802 RepID=A0A8J7IPY5_9FLAO|nr:FecR family protein [Snuella sedimenti]MBJ6368877.1 FecR family protein [Snuella sedimenti]
MKEKEIHPFELLVNKYLDGTITPEEEKLLSSFLETYKEEGLWDLELGSKYEIRDAIAKSINSKLSRSKPKYGKYYMVAASLILLIGIFWGLKWQDGINGDMQMVTTKSQQDSLLLADGSMVYLNRHTTFRYPKTFNDNQRQVELKKGSAFFKVTKNPNKPFIVKTGALKTKVLGTSFNVINKDTLINVSVSTGKVGVCLGDQSVNLLPNEQANWTQGGNIVKRKGNASLYDNWIHKTIDFEDVSLGELSTLFELRFGYNFHFTHSELKDYRVRISILKVDTIKSLVEKLNYITNVKFKIKDNYEIQITLDQQM